MQEQSRERFKTRPSRPATEADSGGPLRETTCPGCGLRMPADPSALYSGYFNTSPECWKVFTDVLAREFGNASLFAQVHQLTSDTYAVQHAGGRHPDKSVAVHLTGLYFALDKKVPLARIPKLHRRVVEAARAWPHFPPPTDMGPLTVGDVANAQSPNDHANVVRAWAVQVWNAWSDHHADIVEFLARHLALG